MGCCSKVLWAHHVHQLPWQQLPWAPWRRVPRITPLNYAAQGTILEIVPFAKSVDFCLVLINSQMHSWLTSDGRNHHCILSCPLKYFVGREERTKCLSCEAISLLWAPLCEVNNQGRLLLHGCQQGWYLLYLPLPSDIRHLRGAVSSINASFHGCVYLQNGSRCLLTWISVYWIYTLCLDQRNIKLIFIDRMCQVQIKLRIF